MYMWHQFNPHQQRILAKVRLQQQAMSELVLFVMMGRTAMRLVVELVRTMVVWPTGYIDLSI